ncbi:histone deacetylase family protein [Legionella impletisoli]|uniref:Deacetylase n=1 Tax=Legionella impletisoli TaxID=343510 RepID=A0A917JPT0_9GAMM|nr:histone deacetylase family protein [Legionella impletisoli]GGI77683.1 deacetylase [Legionella impletisoli]
MLAFITHKDCLLHIIGDFHPECPERLQVITDAVKHSSLQDDIHFYEAPKATREDLVRVHSEGYVTELFKLSPDEGLVCLDQETCLNPHSLEAALRAAGSVVLAVDLVMNKKCHAAFCNVRPPGHHAEPEQAMGFCFFNNVAIGVAYAFERCKLNRIAIVDFDVHHGNGTEAMFKENENVLLCSSFEHPFYPNKPFATESDHLLNLPLAAGTGSSSYRQHVEAQWLEAIDKFQPDFIFFSAGFDGHKADHMADFNLTEEDYSWITQQVKKLADKHCDGRIVSVLEGGYELSVLGKAALAHIKAL